MPIVDAYAERKFQHDCDACRFLGHYFGHDVYFCAKAAPFPTFLARHGDESGDYSSVPEPVLRDQLKPGHLIGGTEDGREWQMPYTDYVFSDRCSCSTSAIFLALSVAGLDALTQKGGDPCQSLTHTPSASSRR